MTLRQGRTRHKHGCNKVNKIQCEQPCSMAQNDIWCSCTVAVLLSGWEQWAFGVAGLIQVVECQELVIGQEKYRGNRERAMKNGSFPRKSEGWACVGRRSHYNLGQWCAGEEIQPWISSEGEQKIAETN